MQARAHSHNLPSLIHYGFILLPSGSSRTLTVLPVSFMKPTDGFGPRPCSSKIAPGQRKDSLPQIKSSICRISSFIDLVVSDRFLSSVIS